MALSEGNLKSVLSVLSQAKANGSQGWLSAAEISGELRAKGTRIHWKTIKTALFEKHDLVDRRKRNNQWEFWTLQAGEQMLQGGDNAIIFVDPTKSVQAVQSLHGILSDLRGVLRICDPYLDHSTIEHLDACQKVTQVRLLTSKITDNGTLRRLVAAYPSAKRTLSVRVVKGVSLHDRYMLDDSRMFILGASLNGFAKGQSFIVRAGQDMKDQMQKLFDSAWTSAVAWQ